jgi:hypothetical protein
MHYITFAAFDDIQDAFELNVKVNLEYFRKAVTDTNEDGSEDVAKVICNAQDGNDYCVIYTGEDFYTIIIDNGSDGLCNVLYFTQSKTLSEALKVMTDIIEIDVEHLIEG